MNGVILDDSKVKLATNQVANAPFTTLQMGLFTTLTALTHATLTATIIADELSVSGYSRQTVSGWGTPTITADFHAITYASTVTFNNSSGSSSALITGWFLYDTAASKIVAAGLFDNPFVILAGSSYITTPFWQLTGEIGSEP
jgi:hypothetical protein